MGMIGNSLAQGLISGANIQDGTVDTPDIKDGAIHTAKVADDAVHTAKIADGAVTSEKLADSVAVSDLSSSGYIRVDSASGGQSYLTLKDNGHTSDYIQMRDSSNGLDNVFTAGGGAIFNEGGKNVDFRVESGDKGSMLYVDGADNRVGINTSDPQHTFHVNQTADSTGIALGMSGRGNSRAQWVMSGVNNEGYTFQHYDGTDTADLLHMNRSYAQFSRYANLKLEPNGLKFDYYRIRSAFAVGYNTTVDTGISVNGGHAGRGLLVMMTGHTSDQFNTQSALYLVRCPYNGDHTPVGEKLGGNYTITVGKSASNTITLHSVSIPVYQIMEISVGI